MNISTFHKMPHQNSCICTTTWQRKAQSVEMTCRQKRKILSKTKEQMITVQYFNYAYEETGRKAKQLYSTNQLFAHPFEHSIARFHPA